MMTKDEAKELTDLELYRRLEIYDSGDVTVIIQQNWPQIMRQLGYVVSKLVADPDTRQTGLTIWQPNPPPSKDIPCTVAVFFNIRDGLLNCSVYMRSSDLWLGVSYDVFNFSMLSHAVCALVNGQLTAPITPGALHLTAASSHLYERDVPAAHACVAAYQDGVMARRPTPWQFHQDYAYLRGTLEALRCTFPGDPLRWWEDQPTPTEEPSDAT